MTDQPGPGKYFFEFLDFIDYSVKYVSRAGNGPEDSIHRNAPVGTRTKPTGVNMNRKLVTFFLSIAGIAAFTTLPAGAQSSAPYPNKTIRLIAPFAGGGALDLIARAVAQKLSAGLGQTVIVENKAGASGAIGSEYVAKAAPDGYTLLLGATTTHGINPALNPKLPYDAVKDFTPISLIATIPHVFVVNPSTPANNLQEFIRLAKSRPDMAYGSAGNGSPHQLSAELFKGMAGIDLIHVPYKGTGPALVDLISGQIHFLSTEMTAAVPHIKAGRLKPLAIAAKQRVPGIDLPTVAEAGFPGFEVTSWYAIFGPPGMPGPVVSRINAELVKAVQDADIKERLRTLEATPVGSTPEELGKYVQAEITRWRKVIKDSKISAD
jgi:tripartite-type tricarboxylate transporter receptor subunit TctC